MSKLINDEVRSEYTFPHLYSQAYVDEKNKEIDRLNKEYERIYNENCKLRENHNINDITLLDENERLNRIIDNIFKFMQKKYDNGDLTGFTISFMELQNLKELKEDNK